MPVNCKWGFCVREHFPLLLQSLKAREWQFQMSRDVGFFHWVPYWHISQCTSCTRGSKSNLWIWGVIQTNELHGFSKYPGSFSWRHLRISLTAWTSMLLAFKTFSKSWGGNPGSPKMPSWPFLKGLGIRDHHGALRARDQVLQGKSMPSMLNKCSFSRILFHLDGRLRSFKGLSLKSTT